MGMCYYRLSRPSDKDELRGLLQSCFGKRDEEDTLSNLTGRYLVAIDPQSDLIIGMSGLHFNSVYNAFEIDWTCTSPEYRKHGVMHNIFKRLLLCVDEPVHCSSWRIHTNEKPNLISLLTDFGFEEVVRGAKSMKQGHNHQCRGIEDCVFHRQDNCLCCEDLYLRKSVSEEDI